MVALKWAECLLLQVNIILEAGVLGDGLRSIEDGVLDQLFRQEETDGGLDLTRGDGGPLFVVNQTANLGGDALKDVDEDDEHGLGGNAGVGVHLLQNLVDVDGVGFLPLLIALVGVLPTLAGLANVGSESAKTVVHTAAGSAGCLPRGPTHCRTDPFKAINNILADIFADGDSQVFQSLFD